MITLLEDNITVYLSKILGLWLQTHTQDTEEYYHLYK